MSGPDMLAAYTNKAIDAAHLIEPTVTSTVEMGLAVRWGLGAISAICGGDGSGAWLMYCERFSKDVDAARRFMVGYLRGVRDYNCAFGKGKRKDSVIGVLAKYTALKDTAVYNKMQSPQTDTRMTESPIMINPPQTCGVPRMRGSLQSRNTTRLGSCRIVVLVVPLDK